MAELTQATDTLLTSAARREDRACVTGAGRYVADRALPGMLHAAFLRSPHASGRIVHLGLDA
jgi:aerobic carbon-monoxide dehydrogenase large subunit